MFSAVTLKCLRIRAQLQISRIHQAQNTTTTFLCWSNNISPLTLQSWFGVYIVKKMGRIRAGTQWFLNLNALEAEWYVVTKWTRTWYSSTVATGRVLNFRFFYYFAKHETIRKPRLFRENFACFAKQKYAKFRFVSFRTTKIEAKFRFVRKSLVLFRENFVSFHIKREIVLRILRHSPGPRSREVAGDRPIEIVPLCLI
jgi:hypothetical protein